MAFIEMEKADSLLTFEAGRGLETIEHKAYGNNDRDKFQQAGTVISIDGLRSFAESSFCDTQALKSNLTNLPPLKNGCFRTAQACPNWNCG